MFTGIIETLGKLTKIEKEGSNIHFTFESPITNELKVDQSVAHNGVCLTVVQLLGDNQYTVTAIDETLQRTNLGELIVGGEVNLERCMPANGRFDGHIVQGHVDGVATVVGLAPGEKWARFDITIPQELGKYIVNQGSIALDGISLTVGEINDDNNQVTVWLIPETLERTNLSTKKAGDLVNVEVDVLAKYVERLISKGVKK